MAYPTDPIYKLHKSPITNEVNCISKKRSDTEEISFGMNPDNRHYQEYLEWVAEGNTAEAAD